MVYYVPGSGGKFLREFIAAYLKDLDFIVINDLGVPPKAISAPVGVSHRFDGERSNANEKIIAIDYTNEDINAILTLNYKKFVRRALNNTEFVNLYQGSDFIINLCNAPEEKKLEIFLKGSSESLYNDLWNIKKNISMFDLVVPFKTLLTDANLLSQQVASFLNKSVNHQLLQCAIRWQSISNSLLNESR